MVARVQVVVEAKDASSGVLRAITGQLGALGGLVEELTAKNVNWGNVTERAATMVIDGIKDAIKVTQEYSQEVRDQMLASGQSAEAASRFLQVLDDYQLTAQDAKTATRAMTKEGLAPTVETLIELSKQYNLLNTAEERNAFVQKNLGRAGQEWLNLLAQGPDRIRAMNDAVSSSLILSEENIKAFEQNRLAVDNWNDAIMGLKVTLGNELLPVMTTAINFVNASNEADKRLREEGLYPGTKAYMERRTELLETIKAENAEKDALVMHSEAMLTDNQAVEESTINYKDLISSIQNAQSETDRYTDKTEELTAKKAELLAGIEKLKKQGYREEGQTIQEERKKLDDLDKELDENAKAHQKWAAQTVFSFAQARAAADGEITKGEGEVLIAVGEQLGLFDQKTAEAMKAVNESFDDLDASNAKATVKSVQDALVALTGHTWVINIATNTSGTVIPPSPPSTGPLGCFDEYTEIHVSEWVTKPIREIQEGDTVMAHDFETGKNIPVTVGRVFRHEAKEERTYYLQVNNIKVTENHPMYVNGKWTCAGNLKFGDELLGFDGKPVIVTRIRKIYKRIPVYNLEVNHPCHNYYAGGVLVHNKLQSGGPVYAGAPEWVGEAGAEPFIPSVNGRILGHAESLHALSMGGGGSNYFYGPVTIEAGTEAGGDVMSIR